MSSLTVNIYIFLPCQKGFIVNFTGWIKLCACASARNQYIFTHKKTCSCISAVKHTHKYTFDASFEFYKLCCLWLFSCVVTINFLIFYSVLSKLCHSFTINHGNNFPIVPKAYKDSISSVFMVLMHFSLEVYGLKNDEWYLFDVKL